MGILKMMFYNLLAPFVGFFGLVYASSHDKLLPHQLTPWIDPAELEGIDDVDAALTEAFGTRPNMVVVASNVTDCWNKYNVFDDDDYSIRWPGHVEGIYGWEYDEVNGLDICDKHFHITEDEGAGACGGSREYPCPAVVILPYNDENAWNCYEIKSIPILGGSRRLYVKALIVDKRAIGDPPTEETEMSLMKDLVQVLVPGTALPRFCPKAGKAERPHSKGTFNVAACDDIYESFVPETLVDYTCLYTEKFNREYQYTGFGAVYAARYEGEPEPTTTSTTTGDSSNATEADTDKTGDSSNATEGDTDKTGDSSNTTEGDTDKTGDSSNTTEGDTDKTADGDSGDSDPQEDDSIFHISAIALTSVVLLFN